MPNLFNLFRSTIDGSFQFGMGFRRLGANHNVGTILND
jgi:hypothetical protein